MTFRTSKSNDSLYNSALCPLDVAAALLHQK